MKTEDVMGHLATEHQVRLLTGKQFDVTVIGYTAEEKPITYFIRFGDLKDKERTWYALRIYLATDLIFKYFVISESWMLFQKPDDEKLHDPNKSIEDHPQRKEGIIIAYCERDGALFNRKCAFQIFNRDNKSKISTFEELRFLTGQKAFEGTLSELLPPILPTPEVIKDLKLLMTHSAWEDYARGVTRVEGDMRQCME